MLDGFVDPYLIPGSRVLRNLLDITNAGTLARAEYRFTLGRRQQLHTSPPVGDFDLLHLQRIHRHLFQDIFDWAGELRTVDIEKRSSAFQPVSKIETGAQFCFGVLHDGPLLRGASVSDREFVKRMSTLFEQINYMHPFREGNGRTQRAFLDQVAERAGRTLAWRNVGENDHIRASIECFDTGSGEAYEWIFAQLMMPPRDGLSLLDHALHRVSPPVTS